MMPNKEGLLMTLINDNHKWTSRMSKRKGSLKNIWRRQAQVVHLFPWNVKTSCQHFNNISVSLQHSWTQNLNFTEAIWSTDSQSPIGMNNLFSQLIGQGIQIPFLKHFGCFVTPEISLRSQGVIILELINHNVRIVLTINYLRNWRR